MYNWHKWSGWDFRFNAQGDCERHFSQCNHFVQKSVRSGIVPTKWKEANVTPIPKGSNASSVSNYRPISLLSVLWRDTCMVLSTDIYLLIILSPFRNRASNHTSQLYQHLWMPCTSVLDKGLEVCIVFFDLKKAFDSVLH